MKFRWRVQIRNLDSPPRSHSWACANNNKRNCKVIKIYREPIITWSKVLLEDIQLISDHKTGKWEDYFTRRYTPTAKRVRRSSEAPRTQRTDRVSMKRFAGALLTDFSQLQSTDTRTSAVAEEEGKRSPTYMASSPSFVLSFCTIHDLSLNGEPS